MKGDAREFKSALLLKIAELEEKHEVKIAELFYRDKDGLILFFEGDTPPHYFKEPGRFLMAGPGNFTHEVTGGGYTEEAMEWGKKMSKAPFFALDVDTGKLYNDKGQEVKEPGPHSYVSPPSKL